MIYKLAFPFSLSFFFFIWGRKSLQFCSCHFFFFCCERLSYYSPFALCHLILSYFKERELEWKAQTARPSLAPTSRLFFLTFGSPINRLHSERWASVFCGHVKPGKCRKDLLLERLLMSLPFCSLIAHHRGHCPSDLGSMKRRCAKCPKPHGRTRNRNSYPLALIVTRFLNENKHALDKLDW